MSDVSIDRKMKGKDLITIGIFSAIYFVINFAFMLLGGIHPPMDVNAVYCSIWGIPIYANGRKRSEKFF